MRNTAVSLVALGLLFAGLAHAEPYGVIEGSIHFEGSGEVMPLGGSFEASLGEDYAPGDGESTVILDSFQFHAGGEVFDPAPLYEYDGLKAFPPSFNLANQIQWIGDGELGFFFFQAGGEPEVAEDGSVTFRHLEFRAGTGSVSPGNPEGGTLPQRLELEGILRENDKTFEIVDSPCSFLDSIPSPPPPPPGGGGAVITLYPIPGLAAAGAPEPWVPDLEGTPIARPCLKVISTSSDEEIGQFSLTATRVQAVEIDVKPRGRRNRINLMRNRRIPVAVLGSESFDVRDLDRRSLGLGPDEAPAVTGRRWWRGWRRGGWGSWWWRRDVNRDGYRDRQFRFRTSETGIAYGDEQVCLTGTLRDGTPIRGCDEIRTVAP